jgi:hypothetical protein
MTKLEASGVAYRKKLLVSGPTNWGTIIEILRDPNLKAVVTKLTGRVYPLILREDYRAYAEPLLEALAAQPNVLFVHESLLTGESLTREELAQRYPFVDDDDVEDGIDVRELYYRDFFDPPEGEVRERVSELLDRYGLTPIPYRTNAELATLADAFIEDNERHLLFRVYVPVGRLYAAEADKLLSLFRDWLGQVGKYSVREDGYRTPMGQVYEFFSDDSLPQAELSRAFDDFSQFLNLCVEDPGQAASLLRDSGMDQALGAQLVARYGKEIRRLKVDLRHAFEARILSVQHALESELLDEGIVAEPAQIHAVVRDMLPASLTLDPRAVLTPMSTIPASPSVTLNLNQ